MNNKRKSPLYKLQSQRTTLLTVLVAVLILVAGIFLIYISNSAIFNISQFNPWRNLIGEVGNLLFVSVTLGVVWELVGKRSFIEEIYTKLDVSASVQSSGLDEIVFHSEEIDWGGLFKKSKSVDLFFAYNIQWRSINEVRLKELVSRRNVILRVVLPDITDMTSMNNMARKFNKEPGRLKERVEEAIEQFQNLSQIALSNNSKVEIWLHNMSFQYSLYRFDDTYIFAPYNQQKEKTDVPHFIFHKYGRVAKFFDADLDFITSDKGSRKIN